MAEGKYLAKDENRLFLSQQVFNMWELLEEQKPIDSRPKIFLIGELDEDWLEYYCKEDIHPYIAKAITIRLDKEVLEQEYLLIPELNFGEEHSVFAFFVFGRDIQEANKQDEIITLINHVRFNFSWMFIFIPENMQSKIKNIYSDDDLIKIIGFNDEKNIITHCSVGLHSIQHGIIDNQYAVIEAIESFSGIAINPIWWADPLDTMISMGDIQFSQVFASGMESMACALQNIENMIVEDFSLNKPSKILYFLRYGNSPVSPEEYQKLNRLKNCTTKDYLWGDARQYFSCQDNKIILVIILSWQ